MLEKLWSAVTFIRTKTRRFDLSSYNFNKDIYDNQSPEQATV